MYIVTGNDIWKHYVELSWCDLAQVWNLLGVIGGAVG
jgi:hypothetical protein